MRFATLLLLLTMLGACGPATVEEQRDLFKMACLVKAGDIFPEIERISEAANGDAPANVEDGEQVLGGEFHVASTGGFSWAMPAGKLFPKKLTCIGDFNRHTIAAIIYAGVIKHPPEGEVWSI